MNYTIESPTTNDTLELATMHNQSWHETYPNEALGIDGAYIETQIAHRLSEKGLLRRESMILFSHDDPSYFLRIARDESGKIVGFIDGHFKDDEYSLDGLYTLKNTHGTGLGKQLWETFLLWAGDHDIQLTVTTYNERAKAFYKKAGFVEKPGTERTFGSTIIPVIDMDRVSTKQL